MHASAAQLPARIQRTDLFNIRDHPATLEHDIDADLSHNAILLRRIYALNNRNKAADVPRRPTLIIIRLEEYNYPAATAIAAIMVLLSFAMLLSGMIGLMCIAHANKVWPRTGKPSV